MRTNYHIKVSFVMVLRSLSSFSKSIGPSVKDCGTYERESKIHEIQRGSNQRRRGRIVLFPKDVKNHFVIRLNRGDVMYQRPWFEPTEYLTDLFTLFTELLTI